MIFSLTNPSRLAYNKYFRNSETDGVLCRLKGDGNNEKIHQTHEKGLVLLLSWAIFYDAGSLRRICPALYQC